MGGGFKQIAVQIIGGFTIGAWAVFWAILAFAVLYRFRLLRDSDRHLSTKDRAFSFIGKPLEPNSRPKFDSIEETGNTIDDSDDSSGIESYLIG
eukprot:TRINITY_DN2736_c0_g2_i1.p1 TRINITY_DN2736_c0_g2~~TRINITY_DN2736_c0_g2_i1.p1  ORF type:complete len:103 (+),score=16.64 TRINITY_DN2736_c0_g2_i1:29-310(+)